MSILSVGLGTLLAIGAAAGAPAKAGVQSFAPSGAQSRTTEPANAE